MVLGYTLAAALFALTASSNALTVPGKRAYSNSPKKVFLHEDYSLEASTEGLPSGVIRQPLKHVINNYTTSAGENSKRDGLPYPYPQTDTDPYEIKGNGTDDILLFGIESFYMGFFELFDGNGASLGTVFSPVDTGSADFWVQSTASIKKNPLAGFGGSFTPELDTTGSVKSLYNGDNFTADYGDGSYANISYYSGTVGTSNTTTPLKNFQFGLASDSSLSMGVAGIGPLAAEITTRQGGFSYSNYPVALKEQGFINKVAFSFYFSELQIGLPSSPAVIPQILWGGIDHGLYTGDLVTFPNQYAVWPATPLDSIYTSNGTKFEINAPVILDSGTTLATLPRALIKSINETLGLDDLGNTSTLPTGNLTIDFGSLVLEVPYANFVYAWSGSYSSPGFFESELDDNKLVFGDAFLRAAYVVFDYEANTTSIAKANYNVTYSDITVL